MVALIVLLFFATVEDVVDNCLETGTFDMEWSQPEVVRTTKKSSEEKSKKIVDESVSDDFGGLDWSKPLVDPVISDIFSYCCKCDPTYDFGCCCWWWC